MVRLALIAWGWGDAQDVGLCAQSETVQDKPGWLVTLPIQITLKINLKTKMHWKLKKHLRITSTKKDIQQDQHSELKLTSVKMHNDFVISKFKDSDKKL